MDFVLHLVCVAVACGASAALGARAGRIGERRRLLSPVVKGKGERRIRDIEDQLRKAIGIRRLSRDPDNAAKVHRMKVRGVAK